MAEHVLTAPYVYDLPASLLNAPPWWQSFNQLVLNEYKHRSALYYNYSELFNTRLREWQGKVVMKQQGARYINQMLIFESEQAFVAFVLSFS